MKSPECEGANNNVLHATKSHAFLKLTIHTFFNANTHEYIQTTLKGYNINTYLFQVALHYFLITEDNISKSRKVFEYVATIYIANINRLPKFYCRSTAYSDFFY